MLYSFGTASGCPTNYPPDNLTGTPTPQNCTPPWTQADVAQVSYAYGYGRIFPEIYLTDTINAQQWYRIALYEKMKYARNLYFYGSLTQEMACKQRPASCGNVNDDPRVTNDPVSGFFQQKNIIARQPISDIMSWPSDIMYQGEPTATP